MAETPWHGLIADAARAEEMFGDDELERFAAELHKRAICEPYKPLPNASAFEAWQELGGEA